MDTLRTNTALSRRTLYGTDEALKKVYQTMMVALGVWLAGAASIAVVVGVTQVGTWGRGILGGLAWPGIPFLIAGSWARYTLRRRGLAR